jgi:hypothetical protein
VVPLIDVEPAMSAGDDKGNRFRAHGAKPGVKDGVAPTPRGTYAAATPQRARRARARRRSRAGVAGRMEPAFRTEVSVCELTVTGVLAGMAGPLVDSIAISGKVQRLSCDEALELVDALLLVVTRIDEFVEKRHSLITNADPRPAADERA